MRSAISLVLGCLLAAALLLGCQEHAFVEPVAFQNSMRNLGESLPGIWFGDHPGDRHSLIGPLDGTAGLDVFWDPKHVDVGPGPPATARTRSGP